MSRALSKSSYEEEKEKIKDFLTQFYVEPTGTDDPMEGNSNDNRPSKQFPYTGQLQRLAQRQQVALYIELDHVASHDPELLDSIQQNTGRYLSLFGQAVDELLSVISDGQAPPVLDALDAFIYQRMEMAKEKSRREQADAMSVVGGPDKHDWKKDYPPELMRRFEVYFKPQSNEKAVSVRDIKAEHIGKFITVRGIVIRSTEVKPLVSVITYTCDTCANETYQPVSGPNFMPAYNCPSRDCVEARANGRLHMQVRGSKFVKFQEIRIQEHSDQVPVGSIPRSLSLYARGENTRLCAPGDHVNISAIFLPQAKFGFKQLAGGLTSEVFAEVQHIRNLHSNDDNEDGAEDELTDEEVELVSQDNFYELLANSIAPEIYGHEDVKKTLLLQLVGGVDKNAAGMKIRGAINVCLMGDPGVAKSQLLCHIDRLAVRSQYTTGRGSSGVGLTAAVMRDPITGEMTLEGGALVLADRGICCIDEFDKMMDGDRTAIHEVMEQQTISIAKAGIMTTLNARVSILAAANPAFGRYNPKRTIEQNVQLPAALLSRFDVLWLIQDKPNRENDMRLAQHIAYVHTHGREPPRQGMEPLDMKLIRKYVSLCKRKQPTIAEALTDRVVQVYVELRREARNNKDTAFTSPRNLLAILRLSTALCRLRLGNVVEEADIQEACRVMVASKDSLRAEKEQKARASKPIDRVFGILRDMYHSIPNDQDKELSLEEARNRIISKGIDEAVLDKCLEVYTEADVLMVNNARTKILFTIHE